MPKGKPRTIWFVCGLAIFLCALAYFPGKRLVGWFVSATLTAFLAFSWLCTGLLYHLSGWFFQHFPSYPQRRIRWKRICITSFLIGINGFFVSTLLIGRSTCDCCQKEHPEAKQHYPFLEKHPTVAAIANHPITIHFYAGILVLIAIVSNGLILFSLSAALIFFNFYLLKKLHPFLQRKA